MSMNQVEVIEALHEITRALKTIAAELRNIKQVFIEQAEKKEND